MQSSIAPVPSRDLLEWPTKRLLALRDRLLRCEMSVVLSDVQDASEIDPAVIRFKDDPRWSALHDSVVAILSTREHVASGAERKLLRQQRAKRSRSSRGALPKRRA